MRKRWIPTSLLLAAVASTLPARAAPDAPRPTLQLVAMEVRGSDNGSMSGSLLTRELQRQAIQIAAWDELGLNIRDTALGDPLLKDSDNQQTLLVETQFNRAAQAQAIVAIPGIAPADNWDTLPDVNMAKFMKANPGMIAAHTHIKLGKNPWMDYALLADTAEKQSRKEFPDALRALPTLTSKGEAPTAWKPDGDPTPDATTLLADMDPFAQFAAVRLLHQQIRTDGASPTRLEALVRAYANLSLLTNSLYSGAYKTYMARSLLYAQRLVTLENASSHSLYVRAYARGIAGLARLALEDLDAAQKKGGDPARWAPLIDAWAHFDFAAMQKCAQQKDDLQPLAETLLYAVTLDNSLHPRQIEVGIRALQSHPDNLWIMQSLFHSGSLGIEGRMPELMQAAIPRNIARALKALHADDTIQQLAGAITGDASTASDAQLEKLRTTLAALDTAGTADNPSNAALATLLADEQFLAVYQQMLFFKYMLGIGQDGVHDFGQRCKPSWEHHPYAGLMEAKTLPDGAGSMEFRAALDKFKPRDGGAWLMTDVMQHLNWGEYTHRWNLWLQAESHLDLMPTDHTLTTITEGRANNDQFIRAMRAESPNSALAFSAYLEKFPEEKRLEDPAATSTAIAEARDKFPESSAVMNTAATWALDINDFKTAEQILTECQQREPSFDVARSLVTLYERTGDYDKAAAVVAAAAHIPSTGLEFANLNNLLAILLMEANRYPDALPYATVAADTGAGWGLNTLAECLDRLGKLDETEELLKDEPHRYHSSMLHWYAWAKFHHRPDLDEAKQAELDFIKAHPGEDEQEFNLVEGDNKHTLELMIAGKGNASSEFLIGLANYAMENDDTKSALEALRRVAAAQDGKEKKLAAALLAIATNDDLPHALQQADLLLEPRANNNASGTASAVGRMLAATGHKTEALYYLAIALRAPWSTYPNYNLCWNIVQKLGEDPDKLRRTNPTLQLKPADLTGAWTANLADAQHEWTFAPNGSVDSSKGFHGHWWEANNHLYIRWTPTKWSALPLPLSAKDWTGNCDAGPNKLTMTKS